MILFFNKKVKDNICKKSVKISSFVEMLCITEATNYFLLPTIYSTCPDAEKPEEQNAVPSDTAGLEELREKPFNSVFQNT